MMSEYEGNLIRVRLVDVQLNKLGVVLEDHDHAPRVRVKELTPGGMLDRSGLVSAVDSWGKVLF